MRISSLEVYNFTNYKAKKFHFNLPVCVIMGENRAGKTNMLRAIELALNGDVVDQVSKKNIDLLRLFGPFDDVMRVVIDIDGLGIVTREFTKRQDATGFKVSQTMTIEPLPESLATTNPGVNVLNAWLKEKLGNLYIFDFLRFFDQSPQKQFEQLFQMFAGSEKITTPIKILGEIKKDNPHLSVIATELIDKNLKDFQLIADLAYKVDKEKKAVNQDVQAFKKTVRKLEEIKSEQIKVTEELEELEGEYRENQIEIEKLQKESETWQIHNRDRKNMLEWITAHKNRLDVLNREKGELDKRLGEIDRLDRLHGLKLTYQTEIRERKEREKEAQKKIAELRNHIEELNKKIDIVKKDIGRSEIVQEYIDFIKENGKCPICNRVFDNGDSQLSIEYLTDQLHEHDREMRFLTDALEKAEAEEKKYNNQLESIHSAIEVLKISLVSLDRKVEEIVALEKNIDKLMIEIVKLNSDLTSAEANLAKATKAINEIGDQSHLITRLQQLNERQMNLKSKIDTANYQRGMLVAQETAHQKYLESKNRLELLKSLDEWIKLYKLRTVNTIFKPIEEKINVYYSSLSNKDENGKVLLKGMDDRGNEAFYIGLQYPVSSILDGEPFVPFQMVNTGHRIKLLLAFLMALPKNNLPLFLVDNCEVISHDYVTSFFRGIFDMIRENPEANIFLTFSRLLEINKLPSGIQYIQLE